MSKRRFTARELQAASRAISQIALKEKKSVEEVRKDMIEALDAGLANPDPKVQAAWKAIPCAGKKPTPEEIIAWSARQVRNQINSQ